MGNEYLRARNGDLRLGRILHQDDEFVTIEVAKRDDVVFHLQTDDEGEVVGGDEFLTFLFVHQVDGGVSVWDPFA